MPEMPGKEAKQPRTPLTLEELKELDQDEAHVLEIIKDVIKVCGGSGAYNEVVIRQARKEGLSERKTKEILTLLQHLNIITYYPTGYQLVA